MDALIAHPSRPGRAWLLWTAAFLSFPIAGIAGTLAAGRVDDPGAALVAGLVTGAVIGIAQSLASSRRLDPGRWTIATSAGMGLGLLAGATAVDFGTTLTDLTVMGLITGVALGTAQALALPPTARHRAAWAAALPLLWAMGWGVTTLAGVDVQAQFTIFGASGAFACAALSGALLHVLSPVTSPNTPPPTTGEIR